MSRRRAQCRLDRKSTRLNSSHQITSYAVFCLQKEELSRLTPGLVARICADTATKMCAGAAFDVAPIAPITLIFSTIINSVFFLKNGGPPEITLFPPPKPLRT